LSIWKIPEFSFEQPFRNFGHLNDRILSRLSVAGLGYYKSGHCYEKKMCCIKAKRHRKKSIWAQKMCYNKVTLYQMYIVVSLTSKSPAKRSFHAVMGVVPAIVREGSGRRIWDLWYIYILAGYPLFQNPKQPISW